jgi:hypothetical protein
MPATIASITKEKGSVLHVIVGNPRVLSSMLGSLVQGISGALKKNNTEGTGYFAGFGRFSTHMPASRVASFVL